LSDLELYAAVVRSGLDSVLEEAPEAYRGAKVAIYLNPSREAGQSQEHLHACMVPYQGLPVVDLSQCGEPAPGRALPLKGSPYAGWIASEAHAALDVILAISELGIAYNLLVLPSETSGRSVSFVIVPLKSDEGGGFRIGGLEMMTGVLIPRRKQLRSMSPDLRDEVFRLTTFNAMDLNETLGERKLRVRKQRAA